jgi:hypothetical protein
VLRVLPKATVVRLGGTDSPSGHQTVARRELSLGTYTDTGREGGGGRTLAKSQMSPDLVNRLRGNNP